MSAGTVRITPETRATLQELAKESKQSMQELVAKAVEQYRRQLILQRTNEAFSKVRGQRGAWSKETEERHIWDSALSDGLDNQE
jgi:predicted transcriptional regulator